MKTIKIKQKYGIDDLKSIYAFVGNSQGDDAGSNNIEHYLNSGGWQSFVFDCELTKEAIEEESEKRKKWNEEYVENLKEEGKYEKEYEISINFEENPIFDSPRQNNSQYSYSFKIVDIKE